MTLRFAVRRGGRCTGIFEASLDAGREPLKLFTIPRDACTGFDRSAIDCGRRRDGGDPAAVGKNGRGIVVAAAYAVCRQSGLFALTARGPALPQHPAVCHFEPLNDGFRV